jgi:DNA polymerase III gamma/tau subunit
MGKYFSDIIGQKSAVKILTAQLESDNISHGYIILGPEGTGKEYLAREFAKYVLCEEKEGDGCDSCVRFDNNSHPDFILVNGKEGIKIDDVREAIERINLSPNLSSFKVLLFTKAENLGIEAANALLKTFEEPPADSIIILTAISEKSLPQTVVSRGQKIKLNVLNKNDIQEILLKEFSKEEIEKVLLYSSGSIGDAKKMLSEPKKLEEKKQYYSDIEKLLKSGSVIEKFKVIEFYDQEKKLKEFFGIFAQEIFCAVAEKLGQPTVGVKAESFEELTLANLASLGYKTLKAYQDLEYNINLKLTMEEMILDNLIVRIKG